jgi:hypothetical protein
LIRPTKENGTGEEELKMGKGRDKLKRKLLAKGKIPDKNLL